jgi:hypothetical protein
VFLIIVGALRERDGFFTKKDRACKALLQVLLIAVGALRKRDGYFAGKDRG